MKVALMQLASPEGESPSDRLERAGRWCTAARGADLIVLPELWRSGYFAFDSYETCAEPLDGDTAAAAADWARDLGCHIHLGSFVERDSGGRLHNTALMVTPHGRSLLVYRKIHLFGLGSREPELITPGAGLTVAATDFGTAGAAICYDLRFPELWRGLVDGGATMAIISAAWPVARVSHWQLLTTCRAVENQMFVIACNAAGTQDGVMLGGRSRVVAPTGEVIAEAGADEEVLFAELEPSLVDRVRREYPALRDRRLRFTVGEHVPDGAHGGAVDEAPEGVASAQPPDGTVTGGRS